MMVSSEGLLWYIFPVERLVGFFRVELFFPAKKAQDERREVVLGPKFWKYYFGRITYLFIGEYSFY